MPFLSPATDLAPIQAILLQCLEEREPSIYRHGCRVAVLAIGVGEVLERPKEELKVLELAAKLQDLGKLLMPPFLVHKAAAFNPEEYRIMQRHALLGARLLESHPDTHLASQVIMHHHERWDGKGYPGRLAGDRIPLPSQITSVVDAYDAMTSDRYGGNQSHAHAAGEILRCRGTQFHPDVVDAFLEAAAQGRIPLAP